MVLALALAFSFSTVAFAAEESGIPENATRHTIELTVEPGENDIAPYIWGQGTYNPPSNGVTYTPFMNIPQRYFAFECSALTTSGASCSGYYVVGLVRNVNTPIFVSENFSINGVVNKCDWITIPNTNATDYQFKIVNATNERLNVSLTYYSWA